VIAASALSLIYPQDGVEGYGRDAFLDDLVDACEQDIRRSLDRGAYRVQIDFTEGACRSSSIPRAACSGTSWRSTTASSSASPTRAHPDRRAHLS
jgi:hypothetical protein